MEQWFEVFSLSWMKIELKMSRSYKKSYLRFLFKTLYSLSRIQPLVYSENNLFVDEVWLRFRGETNKFLNYLGMMSHCFLDASLICKFGSNMGLIWCRLFKAALQVLEQTVTVFRGSIVGLVLHRLLCVGTTSFELICLDWLVQTLDFIQ